MKKQKGIALLEVLVAVSIVGVIMLYVAQLESRQLEHQSRTLSAAKVVKLYQLSTQVMFEPLLQLNYSNPNDVSTWVTNHTISGLQNKLNSGEGFIYLDPKSSSQEVANFFNGVYFSDSDKDSCALDIGVKNERVDCEAGLQSEFALSNDYSIKGIKVDGIKQSFFSVNHVDNSDISNVKPSTVTIFIDGLDRQADLKKLYDLAEMVSEQVSQIDDMENSAYAQIHIADFNQESAGLYDTSVHAHEVLTDKEKYPVSTGMGIAIVFQLDGTQALRSDGMIAMQENRSLCWNVTEGNPADSYICQSAISSQDNIDNGLDGDGNPSNFIQTDGNLVYQTSTQGKTESSDGHYYRTPVEVVVANFSHNEPIQIAKPVCPTIQVRGPNSRPLIPHLSMVGSSFSNSGYGEFPGAESEGYGDNSISDPDHKAELLSGVLFRWNDDRDEKIWDVTGIVASPNDEHGNEGINPDSLQIVALRWCEIEK